MAEVLAALYARVSSDQQAEAHTIGSQIAALRARVAEDGLVVPAEREFLDDGFSGATLVRPALEHLRDLVAEGVIDRIYVHSPDRLARKYAYQALLLDEFQAPVSRWCFSIGRSANHRKTSCCSRCRA